MERPVRCNCSLPLCETRNVFWRRTLWMNVFGNGEGNFQVILDSYFPVVFGDEICREMRWVDGSLTAELYLALK